MRGMLLILVDGIAAPGTAAILVLTSFACLGYIISCQFNGPNYRVSGPCACYSYTSCARGDTICLCPLQVDNIFVFIR